jgi:hypothetical protein
VSVVRILLDPPKPDSPTFEIDHAISIALAALLGSHIKIRGAGRFGEHSAAILLEREGDAVTAVTALKNVGIHAIIGAESKNSKLLGSVVGR